jgi:hypothetical protein
MKMTIENIIKIVKVGTQCIMNNTTYEVIEIKPYSDVCDTPSYTLKIIDVKTIEERKLGLINFKKHNPNIPATLEEFLTMDRIEPMWFITRNAKILN